MTAEQQAEVAFIALGNLLRRLDRMGGTVMEGHARKCGVWSGDGCNCAIAKRIKEGWAALEAYSPKSQGGKP